MKSIILTVLIISLTGCASQQLAQRHWDWLTENSQGGPGYRSGVVNTVITVNGQTYSVSTPAR